LAYGNVFAVVDFANLLSLMVKIELSDQEAEHFKTFMQYREFFEALIKGQTYGIKNGQAILNFDAIGRLSSIERHDCLWHK